MLPILDRLTPLAYAVLTLCAFLAGVWTHYEDNIDHEYAEFQKLAGERAGAAQAVHAHVIGIQTGIATHLGQEKSYRPQDFDQFLRGVTASAPVGAQLYGHVKTVPRARRSGFERDMRQATVNPKFQVWEFDKDQRQVSAGERSVHYPIIDYWPDQATKLPVGLDFAAIPARFALLQEAAARGGPVMSAPTKRVTNPDGGYVYVIAVPYFDAWPHAEGTTPSGYVFGTYAFGEVYEKVVANAPRANQRLYIFASDQGTARPVFFHRGGYRGPALPVPEDAPSFAEVQAMPWFTLNVVKVADRNLYFASVAETPPSVIKMLDPTIILGVLSGLIFSGVIYWVARRRQAAQLHLKRYQETLDASPSPLVFVDRQLCYSLANDAYLQMMDRSREEVIDHPLQDVLPQPIWAVVGKKLEQALAGQQNKFRMDVNLGGSPKTLVVVQVPYRGSSQEVEGVIVTFKDITEEQLLINQLETSAQRYRSLFEDSPMMYLVITRQMGDGKAAITLCNDTACSKLGYRRDELLALPPDALLPEGQQSLLERMPYMTNTAGAGYFYGEFLAKNGSALPVMYRMAIESTGDEKDAVSFRLAVIDLSTEEALRLALSDSEDQFERLVDALPQQVWVLDEKGTLTYLSPRAIEFLGIRDVGAEHYQQEMWDAVHPEDLEGTRLAWQQALGSASPVPFRYEFRLRRADGVYRWFDSQAMPIRDHLGITVKWIGTNADITDRRLTEERLRNSQKMEAIGQLTGGLAHDFNNLLGIIIGNLDMLSLSAADESCKRRLSVAMNAAERGADLVKSLLSVARRQALAPERVNLGELMQRILPLIEHSVGRAIRVECNNQGKGFDAVVDIAGLEAAILNIVINARDAMEQGGALAITVEEASSDDVRGLLRRPYARLTIRDNGSGMSAQTLARATEPFFTTKERGHGTGLGLAMVSGFAEQSGGRMSIQSREGEGTTVTIVLPRCTILPG